VVDASREEIPIMATAMNNAPPARKESLTPFLLALSGIGRLSSNGSVCFKVPCDIFLSIEISSLLAQ
jgi:hypothetical protein